MESPLVSTYGNRIDKALHSANDYHSERHRINKRLAKLRDTLSLKNKNTKNFKKREFSAADYEKNPKIADVLLLNIERDLLFVAETRWVMSVQSSKSKENFVKSKYKKAIGNAVKLLDIIGSAPESVQLQTYIYAAVVQGSSSFFKKRWTESLYACSVARLGLQYLVDTSSDAALKEVATDILVNQVDPVLKLSLYNSETTQSVSPNLNEIAKKQASLGSEKFKYLAPALKLFDASYLEQEDEEMDAVKEISWSKFTCAVHNEDTSRLLLDAQRKSEAPHRDVASYDPALLAWQVLLEHHTLELEKQQDVLSDEEIQDNQILLTYINYKSNFLKIERDLALVEEIDFVSSKNLTKTSIKKSLKVLNSISGTLQATKELPGVYNDESIWQNLEIYDKYYEVLTLVKISQSYLISTRYKEALALLYRASVVESSIDAGTLSRENHEPKLPQLQDLQDLHSKVEQDLVKLQVITEYDASKIGSRDQYYADNLGSVPSNFAKLVNVKEFQMIPQKPVLFDVAFNYIDYDSATPAPATAGAEKKTFFGLFGGNR